MTPFVIQVDHIGQTSIQPAESALSSVASGLILLMLAVAVSLAFVVIMVFP
jgi:hypothetical protein